MNKNCFNIGTKKYAFDIDAISNYFNFSSNNDVKEREITDGYDTDTDDGSMRLQNKFVREVTTTSNENIDSLRYNIVMVFIEKVLDYDLSDYGKIGCGFKIAFNTLLNKGFIIELDE